MRTQPTTQKIEARSERSAVLVSLALGAALAAVVALAGVAQQANAASTEKIVFVSDRTTGTGVDNPTGDYEIFTMDPDGMGVKQLTFNEVYDYEPTLSPDGTKIAYESRGDQTSNPEGDCEIYVMNASDGSGKKNLTNNGLDVDDYGPVFSPGGKKITYSSQGKQTTNPEGDYEVYRVNVLDGMGKKNLTNNGVDVRDFAPVFSPDGKKIAYRSDGAQASNPGGDAEVYLMNTLDGSGKKNLTNNADGVYDGYPDYSPDGKKIAYQSWGIQASNPGGDAEVYLMSALDGKGKKNFTNNGVSANDTYPVFSSGGKKIAYTSHGEQSSNPEGDYEVYRMNALDGTGKRNLSNNDLEVSDAGPVFSPDGTKIVYESYGVQTSNPEGDDEVYVMNVLDGKGKKNLTNNGLEVGGTYPVSDGYPDWGVQGT